MFNDALKKAIYSSVLHPELREILEYAVLPAGKLFRPRLVEAIAQDLTGSVTEDHLHLATAIELHHAYTLVHDDLPAMDNDLVRRGKPATHARFGEWKAILAGDALLIASFDELMKIRSEKIRDLHRLLSWSTGGKGLILGQFLDLGAEGKSSTRETIRIHELKTARLIQVAVAGAGLISEKKFSRNLFRLGNEIGVSFQLFDDLTELTDPVLSSHEGDINPFLLNASDATRALEDSLARLEGLLAKEKLTGLKTMLAEFFNVSRGKVQAGLPTIETHLGKSVTEKIARLTTSS